MNRQPFAPPTNVVVRQAGERGLGVFAARPIGHDEVIEEAPLLLFPTSQLYSPAGTALIAKYIFVVDECQVALALGYGSVYNHSYSPNAIYEDLIPQRMKRFVAIRDIDAGEEITINYNGSPFDSSPVGFDVLS